MCAVWFAVWLVHQEVLSGGGCSEETRRGWGTFNEPCNAFIDALLDLMVLPVLSVWWLSEQPCLSTDGFTGIYSSQLSPQCWSADSERVLIACPQRSRKVKEATSAISGERENVCSFNLQMNQAYLLLLSVMFWVFIPCRTCLLWTSPQGASLLWQPVSHLTPLKRLNHHTLPVAVLLNL